MKKIITLSCLMLLCSFAGMAQKFALIDMEYILKNIPAYEMTNEQLSQVSKKWQNEVEAIQQEAQNMYKNYQSDLVFLSAEMKTKREEEIVKKEQEAQDLKRKYFGPEGELYKKRESLMKPIQDEVYNAVKEISEDKGYQIVWDRASAMSIIFASPKIDISNEVLIKQHPRSGFHAGDARHRLRPAQRAQRDGAPRRGCQHARFQQRRGDHGRRLCRCGLRRQRPGDP